MVGEIGQQRTVLVAGVELDRPQLDTADDRVLQCLVGGPEAGKITLLPPAP